jgi:large subunit ribosomal protein L29
MKPDELRGMSDEQLGLALTDTEKHLFQLRFQSATDRLETPSEIRKAKADIARILTEKRARELKALAAQPDDQLAAALAAAESDEATLGRRKPRRLANRLTAIQTRRAAQTKAPAAKGK